eukprot:TRINITY_DN40768_c0_g1_i1.p1 TRINITY_DN40768_c0_g1~~TRINITY_DN40768_c0_g1_i1.p1  ORF type:complete len:474 (+),score=55.25 TRINITY_DN40768_c0_g1_i1:85-1506(+)
MQRVIQRVSIATSKFFSGPGLICLAACNLCLLVYVALPYDSKTKTKTAHRNAWNFFENRITCGGSYGWDYEGPPCPQPTWEPAWRLNQSTAIQSRANNVWYDPVKASSWGLITFDWQNAADLWQDVIPHDCEERLEEQCRRIKALGTGTKCFVYRQMELSLQWMKTTREAQTEGNKSMYLQVKNSSFCDAAPPCNVATFHQCTSGYCPPCKAHAPVQEENCPYCCNFSSVYNEPIGGKWPHGLSPAHGNNALQDGQFFFDFRNPDVQKFWAEEVILGAVRSQNVDGLFIDDPAGYGSEHPAIQPAVQLSAEDIAALQVKTQEAWNYALEKLVPLGKYVWQAFEAVPPGPSAESSELCEEWMRAQCFRAANSSAVIYAGPSTTDLNSASLQIAGFLVTRGPYSYIAADPAIIEGRNSSDPFYQLFQQDFGSPLQSCMEPEQGLFTRLWERGKLSVDCRNLSFSSYSYSATSEII